MQLMSASVNEIQTGHTARLFNAVEYIRNYESVMGQQLSTHT